MRTTPKSLRLHIALFGRANVGKSSLLNLIAGQDVAITSPVAGTTTDVVEKVLELLPVGPVVVLDTAGLDDTSALAVERSRKTRAVFDRADVILLVVTAGRWDSFEQEIVAEARQRSVPVIGVVNKIDLEPPVPAFLATAGAQVDGMLQVSCVDAAGRDAFLHALKQHLMTVMPEETLAPPAIIGDLVPPGGLAVLIVPIDLEAPKGRLILPQVQTIRDALDNDAVALVVKDREYAHALTLLARQPDLVVCDSQVVMKMVADTPAAVRCTTFSILFSRYRGDLLEAVKSAAVLKTLRSGDRVLIAEACSHHAIEDDIGRVKLPRWLRQFTGADLSIDTVAGHDYPANLKDYRLVIHCGGCMISRRHMLTRIAQAKAAGVPITNYGIAISFMQGVLPRVLSPFPVAATLVEKMPGTSAK